MQRLFFIFLLIFISQMSFAQSLKGIVREATTQEPIPYATILLKNTTDEFIEGVTTDADGKYFLKTKKGTYKVEVSFIGYEKIVMDVTINKPQQLDFKLAKGIATLDEVTVVAEQTTVQQLIDKKVVNVGKDLLSSGGDAATVLSQLSEVQADENGNISLRGSSNVNVLVNGKPSPLSTSELLLEIPSSTIAKIEIITSPSAKYQANGLTGIINIITNK